MQKVYNSKMRAFNFDRIKPEKAVEILKQKGFNVTIDQAKNILDLLYILAKLEVEQYLKR
jgi:hypothetical protein